MGSNVQMAAVAVVALAAAPHLEAATLAERVAADFGAAEMRQPLQHYVVPAMSGVQRLPDAYPEDGAPGAPVRIVLAKDEYEPGSFLLWSRWGASNVQLALSPFKNERGDVLPAGNLDLKVIKVWYQNKNGWFSYFGDTGFKLCPELLLNDENLIRVDTKRGANYARIREQDGRTREQWLNPPREMNRVFFDYYRGGDAFASMRPGFEDADTLQPVAFEKGAFKQFFLTVRTTKDTPAGLYRGTIALSAGQQPLGTIPVLVRVLDFVLPKPMCYADANRPFHVNFYNYECFGMMMEVNGGDLELTKRQAAAVLKDHAAHGQDVNWLRYSLLSAESVTHQKLSDEAGYDRNILCGPAPFSKQGGTETERHADMARAAAALRKQYGERDVYLAIGDEPSPQWVKHMRKHLEMVQSHGFKLILAGSDAVYRKGGYFYDWFNSSRPPENDEVPTRWGRFGTAPDVAWYSSQHVGAEDPDFNRRQNGLCAYLSGYTCLCNYAHHFGEYNDDREGYKPMVYTYGQAKGVIDTLQWEGFREGLDDIRYATLMVRLAREAAADRKSVRRRYEGNKALQFLAEFRKESDDLNAARMEMIRYIQKLALLK